MSGMEPFRLLRLKSIRVRLVRMVREPVTAGYDSVSVSIIESKQISVTLFTKPVKLGTGPGRRKSENRTGKALQKKLVTLLGIRVTRAARVNGVKPLPFRRTCIK